MGLLRTLRNDLMGLRKYYNFSQWIMRLVLFAYILIVYSGRLTYLDVNSEYFLLAVIYTFFGFFVIVGGFSRSSELTRISSIVMLITVVAHTSASFFIYHNFDEAFASRLLFIGILLYFATVSKRSDYYWRSKYDRKDLDVEEMVLNPKDKEMNQ
ncbi:MAG: hypothetical protein HOD63_03795 [Bacteroidetes bacterium]|jgi:hypothetical protein|nr:hypothetical protein [Bacteroidota bacterium]MBT5530457.1 hypothetical protein [Cytophagia bacterium]MBT3423513.1 hypothetical protein [Bacteroidota bacterium]MBT3801908.1 hypothetical protein [Bacteroidota bacterium]MBT4337688.1 hypothetical protein [Bacteroidota bacterium]